MITKWKGGGFYFYTERTLPTNTYPDKARVDVDFPFETDTERKGNYLSTEQYRQHIWSTFKDIFEKYPDLVKTNHWLGWNR